MLQDFEGGELGKNLTCKNSAYSFQLLATPMDSQGTALRQLCPCHNYIYSDPNQVKPYKPSTRQLGVSFSPARLSRLHHASIE